MGVLQGLAVREVKAIADTFLRNGVPTATSEAVRTALQGLVGCAGAAPTGNCASGALGAASSVVLNNLIRELSAPRPRDPITNQEIPLSLADQQSRTALIATLTGAIAGALGANAGVASNAGVIETENNALNVNGSLEQLVLLRNPTSAQRAEARRRVADYFANDPEGKLALQAAGGNQALAERCLLPNAGGVACGAVQARLNELTTAAASATIVARVNFYDLVSGGGAILDGAGRLIGHVELNYGQPITRVLGALQTVGGTFDIVVGSGIVAAGIITCIPTTGAGCAGVFAGGALIGIGVDNVVAGSTTSVTGRYRPTNGARAFASLTGVSIETAELFYGLSSFGVSAANSSVQSLSRTATARAQAGILDDAVEAEAARLGDSLAGQSFANGVTCVYDCVIGGVTRYIGITDDAFRRGREQLRLRNIEIEEIQGLTNLSRSDARAVEQVLINFHGLGANGGTLINQINSISRVTNKTKYEVALVRGAEILRSIRYPGFM